MANVGKYRVSIVATPDDPGKLLGVVARLDATIFPADVRETLPGRYWWLAFTASGRAVGYAGLGVIDGGEYGYFCRAGVLATHRNRGLHRRLIAARMRQAKRLGMRGVITYTAVGNSASINALLSRGFKSYVPEHAWAGERFCYWRKDFD